MMEVCGIAILSGLTTVVAIVSLVCVISALIAIQESSSIEQFFDIFKECFDMQFVVCNGKIQICAILLWLFIFLELMLSMKENEHNASNQKLVCTCNCLNCSNIIERASSNTGEK